MTNSGESNTNTGDVCLLIDGDRNIHTVGVMADGELARRFERGAQLLDYFDSSSGDGLQQALQRCRDFGSIQDCWVSCQTSSQKTSLLHLQCAAFREGLEPTCVFAVRVRDAGTPGSEPNDRGQQIAPAQFAKNTRAVAHELNNLLTTIISFGGFLAEDLPADSPMREDVSEVLTAARSAASLVEELLRPSVGTESAGE
jgi:signal transduction histidine kinase